MDNDAMNDKICMNCKFFSQKIFGGDNSGKCFVHYDQDQQIDWRKGTDTCREWEKEIGRQE